MATGPVRIRSGTTAEWEASERPVLLDRELAYDETKDEFYVGDGVTPISELTGVGGPGGGGAGADGKSAYQLAVDEGFTGTVNEWLASLQGADGEDGTPGTPGNPGAAGASAYEVAVANGFAGDQTAWLLSLRGLDGANGATPNAAYKLLLDTVDYPAMRSFFAALANRRNESVPIFMFGDSTVEGYDLTAFSDTLPQQLARNLRDRFPVPGVTGGPGLIGIQTSLTSPFSYWPGVAAGGAAIAVTSTGPASKAIRLNAAGKKYTITTGALTSFDIILTKGAAGAVGGGYYKIDGGTAQPIDTNNASALATRIPVNSPVVSTIEFGWNSGTFDLHGIIGYNGDETKGVKVHNAGYSGAVSSGWSSTASTAGGWTYHAALLAPKLAIYQIGGNDKITNVPVATFKTNVLAAIAGLRARSVSCPIILSMVWDAVTGTNAWSGYVTAAKEIAAADPTVVVVDHSARMYPWSGVTDPAGLYNAASSPHANARGTALLAATLAAAVIPR